MRQVIENFMRSYDPGQQHGPPSGSGSYSQGSDLLSLFIQAYNTARQFFRGLPPIYLQGVANIYDIRNRILDRSTYELIIVGGKVGRLPSPVVSAIEERAFIPDRTYPTIKIRWAMAKEDLPQYEPWKARQGLRADLKLEARGEEVPGAMEPEVVITPEALEEKRRILDELAAEAQELGLYEPWGPQD